jgi:hypothetical protein
MILIWDLQLIKCDHAHHIGLDRDILHWRGNMDQVIEPFGNHKSSGWKFLESLSDCYGGYTLVTLPRILSKVGYAVTLQVCTHP